MTAVSTTRRVVLLGLLWTFAVWLKVEVVAKATRITWRELSVTFVIFWWLMFVLQFGDLSGRPWR